MDAERRPLWIIMGITAVVIAYLMWRYNQSQNPPLMCLMTGGHFSWVTGWSCG